METDWLHEHDTCDPWPSRCTRLGRPPAASITLNTEQAKRLAWISAVTLSPDFCGVQIKSAHSTSLLVPTAAPTTDLVTVTTEQSPSTAAPTNTAAFQHVLRASAGPDQGEVGCFSLKTVNGEKDVFTPENSWVHVFSFDCLL